ncbi:MAG: acyltransferase family protein [Lewinellaceae bacterium]|nr:acyltransferase family protein [Lewinellaceae bacterium]
MPPPRLLFIDNLRTFLISLVLLHHLSITYGAAGSWYYNEARLEGLDFLPMLLFVVTNQSFFMGLFFLISAYFTVPSLDRKGAGKFLKDRLIRLGIPILIFFFVLSPLTVFLAVRAGGNTDLSFLNFLREGRGFGFGPMWFVEALLLFSLVYLAVRYFSSKKTAETSNSIPLPKDGIILLFALGMGLLSFVVRIWLPVGWSLQPFGFQFPHFVQYISLFMVGLVAYRNNWLEQISFQRGIRWFVAAQGLIFIVFPALFFLSGLATGGSSDAFVGGFHWQSLSYSVWEQVTGVSLIMGLIAIFRKRWNLQGTTARRLSDSAYAAYLIHPPILVGIALVFRDMHLHPIFKFVLLAPLAWLFVFFLANLVRKLPGLRKVL